MTDKLLLPHLRPLPMLGPHRLKTGRNLRDYRLTNVQLRLGTPPATNYQHSSFKVAIWSSTTESKVNAKLHDLTTPSSFSAGLVSFTATNVILARDTTYFVVVQDDNETDSPTIARTQATAEDSGGFANWSIGNFRHRTPRSLPDWNNAPLSGLIIRLTVNGTPITVPDAPQNLAAKAGDTQATLTWAAPESDGGASISRYEYRHAMGSIVPDSTTWTPVPDGSDAGSSTADETTVTVENLTNGTHYAFEVRAVNSVGGGTEAGPVTARPVRMAHDELHSTSMTVKTATRSALIVGYDSANTRYPGSSMTDNTFTVDSTNYTIPEIHRTAGYAYVYLSPLPSTGVVANWAIEIEGYSFNFGGGTRQSADGRFEINTAAPGQGHNIAFLNEFADNATLTVRIVDTATIISVPDAPEHLTGEVGNAQVTLRWAAPTSDGGGAIRKYEYRYSTGSTVSESAIWTDVPRRQRRRRQHRRRE